jgi:hypothetical protein
MKNKPARRRRSRTLDLGVLSTEAGCAMMAGVFAMLFGRLVAGSRSAREKKAEARAQRRRIERARRAVATYRSRVRAEKIASLPSHSPEQCAPLATLNAFPATMPPDSSAHPSAPATPKKKANHAKRR